MSIYTDSQVYEYMSREMDEEIIEWKTCVLSGAKYPVFSGDRDFYKQLSPTIGGKQFLLSAPDICPEERQRQRLLFRNGSKLYRRQCDASKKSIVSVYSPDKPYTVYDQKIRRSDIRDPLQYGRDFDYNKTFTEQFAELMQLVPRYSLYNFDTENCDYVQYVPHSKNCYMTFGGWYNEDCLYGGTVLECKFCVDCFYAKKSEYCYKCTDIENCYRCFYCVRSVDCRFSSYLQDCKNCDHCYNCTNLVDKSYCIYNKQYTKKAYEEALQKIQGQDVLLPPALLRSTIQSNSESSLGNMIYDSKNCFSVFESWGSDHVRYSYVSIENKDCMDVSRCAKGSLVYQAISSDYGYKTIGALDSEHCTDSYYIDICYESDHLFGCIGLRNKSYCIFNKQYSPEDREKEVVKIISHMQETPTQSSGVGERGNFFDASLSPFGYNETLAQDYFPLYKQEAIVRDYKWQDKNYDPSLPEGAEVIRPIDYDQANWLKLRDDDSILRKIFICEVSGRPYKLQPSELAFYRKMDLPLPRRHYDIRHEERLAERQGRMLYVYNCDACGREIVSIYTSEEKCKRRIYCEQCYQKEVYG